MAWNLRVSAALHQGDRKYMEDQYAIHYECDKDTGKFVYAYFGIFDGHGGGDAAKYAKLQLHRNIINNSNFWSDEEDNVLKSIEEGFLKTHNDMWKEIHKWPQTATGLPSTAGTTASIAIIKGNKLYTGHVGDSGIALGSQLDGNGKGPYTFEHLTVDHKPDSLLEKDRIEKMGGSVVAKAGVPRVVWNRPRHKGPVRGYTHVDKIPFLAVARALGDLWSYDFDTQAYAVDPRPDVAVREINPYENKCLILASDGLWNLLDSRGAVTTVEMTERKWFREALYEKGDGQMVTRRQRTHPQTNNPYYHPASTLVNTVLRRWRVRNLRADNTSAIVVMIDPPGETIHNVLNKFTSEDHIMRRTSNCNHFCARTYLKENNALLTDAERYVLGMTGSYNLQYYNDSDRFEMHFGEPTTRFNIPKGCDLLTADGSIALYDVIIHKVTTPVKGSLISKSPISSCLPRKSLSAKALKKFRPQVDVPTWPSDDVAESDYDVYDPHGEKLPNWLDGDEFDTKQTKGRSTKELSSLAINEQSCGSSPTNLVAAENVSLNADSSNDDDSKQAQTELLEPIVSNQKLQRPVTIRLSAAAHSEKSEKDGCGMLDSIMEIATRSMRKLSRKTAVVLVSPLKAKRQLNGSTSVDLVAKRRRLSMPSILLTKVTKPSSTTSPSSRTRSKVAY